MRNIFNKQLNKYTVIYSQFVVFKCLLCFVVKSSNILSVIANIIPKNKYLVLTVCTPLPVDHEINKFLLSEHGCIVPSSVYCL